MMAGQQLVFAETVAAMKRALVKCDDASESDNSISRPTNRGNKLKRKAKYVQEGKLNQANGPCVYRKKYHYNGYQRHVISRNPPRVDFDGDIIEDDDGETAELSPAEEDPYADIRLEEILMPLTSAANLHTHPSLSKPYYSKNLDEMVNNAEDMVRREQASLWKAKELLTRFRGDAIWMPCGMMESDHDIFVFGQQQIEATLTSPVKADIESSDLPPPGWEDVSAGKPEGGSEDVVALENNSNFPESSLRRGASTNSAIANIAQKPELGASMESNDTVLAEYSKRNGSSMGTDTINNAAKLGKNMSEGSASEPFDHTKNLPQRDVAASSQENLKIVDEPVAGIAAVVGVGETMIDSENISIDGTFRGNRRIDVNGDSAAQLDDSEMEEEDAERPPHRMTTRARAQAATDIDTLSPNISGSPTPSTPFVHPFFSIPPQALPDADCGLPPAEADKTRRLLMIYVQKQEEVCRGAKSLHDGLLRASRLRNTVLRWCKAEGHVGELDDGEDWYDLEEWGLDEDLKKGEEQEDDDGGIVGPNKKTRRARAAA